MSVSVPEADSGRAVALAGHARTLVDSRCLSVCLSVTPVSVSVPEADSGQAVALAGYAHTLVDSRCLSVCHVSVCVST